MLYSTGKVFQGLILLNLRKLDLQLKVFWLMIGLDKVIRSLGSYKTCSLFIFALVLYSVVFFSIVNTI